MLEDEVIASQLEALLTSAITAQENLSISLQEKTKMRGIVKQQRKPNLKLIVAPNPYQQRGSDQFFFQPLLKSP